MLREKRGACLLGALALTLALTACGRDAPPRTPPVTGDAAARPLPVALAPVARDSVTASWQGTATLVARRDAEVAARVGGAIAEIRVEVGDRVEQGQALARLDDERLALEADRARALYRQRQAEAERAERLLARELISDDEHEQAVSNLQTARAEYELAALTVREATVRAPFPGRIAERHIRLGNTIAAGEAAFRVVDLDTLETTLAVPERDVAQLAVGQPAELRADALPERYFSGEVARISPAVDADTGTVAVTVAVDGAGATLMPGMFVRVAVVFDRREDVLTVPEAAVQREDGAAFVFTAETADDGLVARRTELALGYRSAGRVEVTAGLSGDERVVVSGVGGLRDGMRLSDIAAAEAAPPGGEQG
ncbi:efflux RND transporter periplasmic adaptor subunit [Algiphilus sp.]|uniref:efflux RND transporter periplasmic adaptor subunit n=1 Tax=Algiphilus sp. TaxID=1872431 RepID=UPI0025BFF45E|nr:efflux RND transporter periplasmic adaptor subunit [Algiphilus sp.]MCK5769935.1 efflux RND transporter periplasmic adaptor subunit [Algiphilus sp.]